MSSTPAALSGALWNLALPGFLRCHECQLLHLLKGKSTKEVLMVVEKSLKTWLQCSLYHKGKQQPEVFYRWFVCLLWKSQILFNTECQHYHVWLAPDFGGVAWSWRFLWHLDSFFQHLLWRRLHLHPRIVLRVSCFYQHLSCCSTSIPHSWPTSLSLLPNCFLSLFKEFLFKHKMPKQILCLSTFCLYILLLSIWSTA